MVFNVIANNTDGHNKNSSFILEIRLAEKLFPLE